jgi:hypothetical protein
MLATVSRRASATVAAIIDSWQQQQHDSAADNSALSSPDVCAPRRVTHGSKRPFAECDDLVVASDCDNNSDDDDDCSQLSTATTTPKGSRCSAEEAASSSPDATCSERQSPLPAEPSARDVLAAALVRETAAADAAAARTTAEPINVFAAQFIDAADPVPSLGRFERTGDGAARFAAAVWAFYLRELHTLLPGENMAHVRTVRLGERVVKSTHVIDTRALLLCALEARTHSDELHCRDILFVSDFSDFAALPLWHEKRRACHDPPKLLSLEVCVVRSRQWHERALRFLGERHLSAPHYWAAQFEDTCASLVARARHPHCADDSEELVQAEREARREAVALALRMLGALEGNPWYNPHRKPH